MSIFLKRPKLDICISEYKKINMFLFCFLITINLSFLISLGIYFSKIILFSILLITLMTKENLHFLDGKYFLFF